MVQTLKITLSSELPLLDTVKQAFDNFMEAVAADGEDFQYWCWVGIQEALVNAIRHGNSERSDLPVEFFIEVLETGIRFRVKDSGTGVDLAEIPDPTAPENLLRSSGRGFLFIQNAMDRVSTKRKPGSFTLIMEKDFKGV
ncbi:MAG: ATP-binding protein [Acidobacteria bacterium]|nr:ATP-binding protein [Acidobacteriota bacterium]